MDTYIYIYIHMDLSGIIIWYYIYIYYPRWLDAYPYHNGNPDILAVVTTVNMDSGPSPR